MSGWDRDVIEAHAVSERGDEVVIAIPSNESDDKKLFLKADYANVDQPSAPTIPVDGPPQANGSNLKVHFEVSVPRYIEFDVIRVQRSDVQITGVETSISVWGGQSSVILKRVGSVEAHTRSGNVELEGAAGPVSVTTAAGAVKPHRVQGNVRVVSISGPIEIKCVQGRVEVANTQRPIDLVNPTINVRMIVNHPKGYTIKFSSAPKRIEETKSEWRADKVFLRGEVVTLWWRPENPQGFSS